jgi:hypothetical protein
MKLENPMTMSKIMIDRLGAVSCKTAIRLAERAVVDASLMINEDCTTEEAQIASLEVILDDYTGDQVISNDICTTRY